MKKLPTILVVFMMIYTMTPHFSEAKGFGGSHSISRPSSTFSHSGTSTYHSGYKSPSSKVNRGTSSSVNQSKPSIGRSVATHASAFGAGALLGSMFHPFGGHYEGGSFGFSFLGLLLDVVLILVIVWLIKSIFMKRRD